MKLLVGLGNPGIKYQNNRHNAGHMFIDYIMRRHSQHIRQAQPKPDRESDLNQILASARMTCFHEDDKRSEDDRFVKTTVFMNQSGAEVQKTLKYSGLEIEDLIVVHDDLDIALGRFKIEKGVGPKLHNGIASIEEALGTKKFWRVRLGVDNPSTRFTRSGQVRIDGETYVLQDFSPQEKEILLKTLPEAYDKLRSTL